MDIEWSEEDSDGFAAERINFVECGFRRGHPALVRSTFPSCLGFWSDFRSRISLRMEDCDGFEPLRIVCVGRAKFRPCGANLRSKSSERDTMRC